MADAFSVVNYAKFSSLFHLIGQIYTNLDNLAPVDSINVENCTQKFRYSGTLIVTSGTTAICCCVKMLSKSANDPNNRGLIQQKSKR